MKTRISLFLLFISSYFSLRAQTANTWTKLNDFNGVARSNAVSFVIGNDAYVGTGLSASGTKLNDFWRYNSSTDSWSQVQNATPYPRHRAIAFGIGNKGYMGTGDIGNSLEFQTNDFWEYDPSQNIWTVKLSVGLAARQSAVAFVLNNKGYVTTGYTSTATTVTYDNSLWEYDPATGIWTQRPNFPSTGRETAGSFNIGNIGYLTGGTNLNSTLFFKDLWSYDPNSQQWQLKAAYPTNILPSPIVSCFAIGNKGYIFGRNDSPQFGTNYFLEYDPSLNSYNSKSIPSTFSSAASFSLCTAGYLVTGGGTKNVFRYDPDPGITITGPTLVCNTSVFTTANNPNNLPTTWSSSNPSGLSINATTGVATRLNNFNGQATITATIAGACGNLNVTRSVIVGTGVADPLIEQKTVICPTGPTFYSILGRVTQSADIAATYRWYIGTAARTNFVLKATTTSNSATVPGNAVDNLFWTLRVDITNSCGTITTALREGRFRASCTGGGGVQLAAFPNPSASQLSLEFVSEDTDLSAESASSDPLWDIVKKDFNAQLFTPYGALAKIGKSKEGKLSIDTSSLPEGLYFLKVSKDGEVITRQISIKH
jgi:hypothetical protein